MPNERQELERLKAKYSGLLNVQNERSELERLKSKYGLGDVSQLDTAVNTPPMPAVSTAVSPDVQQGGGPTSLRDMFRYLPKGTAEAAVGAVSPGRASLEGRFMPHDIVGRLAANAIAGIPEFAVGLPLGAVEDPLGTAKGLLEFYPHVGKKLAGAFGLGVDYNRPLTESPFYRASDEETAAARHEIGQNPLDIALAALPLLKGAKGAVRRPGRVAEAVTREPVRPVVEPSGKQPVKLDIGDTSKLPKQPTAPTPESIAAELGVEFRGIQPGARGTQVYNWHDPQHGGDFYTKTIEELPTKMAEKRAEFAGPATKPEPIAPKTETVQPKQPWEMTRAEYRKQLIAEKNIARSEYERSGGGVAAYQRKTVKQRRALQTRQAPDAATQKAAAASRTAQRLDQFDSGRNIEGMPSEHLDAVKQALSSGKLTPKRAEELGHFETYPDLAKPEQPVIDQPATKTAPGTEGVKAQTQLKPEHRETIEAIDAAVNSIDKIITENKAGEVVSGGKYANETVTIGKQALPGRTAWTTDPWLAEAQVDYTTLRRATSNILNDKPLTANQRKELNTAVRAFTKYRQGKLSADKAETPVGDLNLSRGDEVRIDGDWHRVVAERPDGRVVLKDGRTFEVDAFDRLPVDASTTKGRPLVRRDVPPGETNLSKWDDVGAPEPIKRRATSEDISALEGSVGEPTATVPETPKETIGLNKVELDRIRKHTGLDQLPEAERSTWTDRLNEVKERRLDESALETAREVLGTKRPLTDAEHAGMVVKAAKLADEYDVATKTISDLVEKGDSKAAQIEVGRRDIILDQIDQLTDATKQGRREAARTLSIGRMMLNRDDYSLASVMQRATAAKGKRLTPEETVKIERIVGEHGKLEQQLKELEGKYEKELAEREKVVADEVTKRLAVRGRTEKRIAVKREKLIEQRADIKKQLAALGFRINDITGVSAEGSYLIGKLAINYIHEGALTLEQVVAKVKTDLPGLTDRDVHRALIARDPKRQRVARADAVKRVGVLKQQAKLLLEIEKAEKGIIEKAEPGVLPAPPIQIRQLQRRLRDLRSGLYQSGIDPARLERGIQTINELQDQLANHYRNVKKRKAAPTEELTQIQEKIKKLRNEVRIEDALADVNEQLRTGEFKIPEKPRVMELPPELERKQVELQIARRQIKTAIRESAPWTTRRVVGEIANFNRAALSTADMSGWFRQNVVPVFSHPIKTARLSPKITKAFFSEFEAQKIDQQMRSKPHSYLYEKSKLALRELDGIASRKEESFMSNVFEKIPIVKVVARASNRNMTTMGNLIRTSLFDDFLAKNPNATHAEMTAYANALNVFTGIGDLGRFAGVANELAFGFFSPKLAVARPQTPYMLAKHWRMPRVRKQIARDLAGFVATGSTILGLAKLWESDDNDISVGDDPREADWGKIRVGNTRVDIWGGFQQPARLIWRSGLSISDRAGWTGKGLSDFDKQFDPLEEFMRFTQFKVSPFIGLARELTTGKTAVGQPVTIPETFARSVTPLVYQDVTDAYREAGWGRVAWATPLAFVGVGVNTYEDSQSRIRRDIRKMVRAGDVDKAYQTMYQWNEEHPDKRIGKQTIKNALIGAEKAKR